MLRWIIAAVVCLIAGVGIGRFSRPDPPKPPAPQIPPSLRVYVARSAIDQGVILHRDQFEIVSAEAVPPAAAQTAIAVGSSAEAMIFDAWHQHWQTAVPLASRDVLSLSDLQREKGHFVHIPEGFSAITIANIDAANLGGWASPGDVVDLYFVTDRNAAESNALEGLETELLVPKIVILHVGAKVSAPEKAVAFGPPRSDRYLLLTLLVPDDQVLPIWNRVSRGELGVALRTQDAVDAEPASQRE